MVDSLGRILDLRFLGSLYLRGFGHGIFSPERATLTVGSFASSRRHFPEGTNMPSHGHTADVLRRSQRRSLPIVALMILGAAGCSKMGQLTAMKNFKEANQAYAQQDYKRAAELYENTVAANPDLNYAYFYLGNSYDNLYKPSKKGEPENDQLLEKAVKNYQQAATKLATGSTKAEKDLARLSMK